MLIKKENCFKCRSERSVRPCPRLSGKNIGWNCCNSLRIDLRCPQECPYSAQADEKGISPFPAFRSDSNTEFSQAAKRFIDLWRYMPNPELENANPHDLAQSDSAKVLAWLEKFQYPANFPISYLMQKLDIQHEEQPEPETPETIAFAFLDAVIALDWDKLRGFTVNDLDHPELAQRYAKLLSAVPEFQKIKDYQVLHAGAADDGVSAMVMLELNRKLDWTLLLSSQNGHWRIKQNLNGSPQLYYAQNQLFRSIAEALGAGQEAQAAELLSTNLPLYPDCADLRYYQALLWQLRKNPTLAKEELLNSLALDNHFFEAGFALAALYIDAKELPAALAWLRILQKQRPEDLHVQNNLAACEAGLGNVDKARELWNGILKTAPNYEPAKKNLERYQQ